MNGRMAKRLRRLNKARIEEELARKKAIGVMSAAPVLTADMLIPYMISCFIGKCGYNYMSLGRYGSVFINDKYNDISPIVVHT